MVVVLDRGGGGGVDTVSLSGCMEELDASGVRALDQSSGKVEEGGGRADAGGGLQIESGCLIDYIGRRVAGGNQTDGNRGSGREGSGIGGAGAYCNGGV